MTNEQNALQELDAQTNQLLVEARVVEVSASRDLEWEIRHQFTVDPSRGTFLRDSDVALGVPGAATANQGLDVGLRIFNENGKQLESFMRLLNSRGRARILSSPNLIVAPGEEASIITGEEVPVQIKRLLEAHEIILKASRAAARGASTAAVRRTLRQPGTMLSDDVDDSTVRTRMGLGRTWHRVEDLGPVVALEVAAVESPDVAELAHRRRRAVGDPQQAYAQVKKLDAENGITWLPAAAMNDTYALAVKDGGPVPATNLTGLANQLLGFFGIGQVSWLTDTAWSLPSRALPSWAGEPARHRPAGSG